MKLPSTLWILILLLFGCYREEGNYTLLIDSLPEEKEAYQKTIVGHLSGEFELANNTKIKSRWSAEERIQAKNYLKELISSLNITAKENNYTAPNLNPAIDLLLNPYKGTNLYGILPATTNSNEYVILGAHYDTGKRNAPGAIDNATGIVLIYSVVKELAKSPVRNKNLVLVFFDQEEEELIGSKAFAKFLKGNPWDIHSIHCFDMVGWDGNQDKAMEMYSPSESLRTLYKKVAEGYNIPLKEISIDPIGYDVSSTDFDAFVPFGFNVIGAGECFYHRDSTPFKDSPDDRYNTVDFEYLSSCSDLVEAIITEIVVL